MLVLKVEKHWSALRLLKQLPDRSLRKFEKHWPNWHVLHGIFILAASLYYFDFRTSFKVFLAIKCEDCDPLSIQIF